MEEIEQKLEDKVASVLHKNLPWRLSALDRTDLSHCALSFSSEFYVSSPQGFRFSNLVSKIPHALQLTHEEMKSLNC